MDLTTLTDAQMCAVLRYDGAALDTVLDTTVEERLAEAARRIAALRARVAELEARLKEAEDAEVCRSLPAAEQAVDYDTIMHLLHLRSLAIAWALCQSAMDDLDKVGEVSDKASAEWNAWMSASRRAGDDLLEWCRADADREIVDEMLAKLRQGAK